MVLPNGCEKRSGDDFWTAPEAPADYWGELSLQDMQQLIEVARASSQPLTSLFHFLASHRRSDLYAYIADHVGRGSWLDLIQPATRLRALDVGAGLGGVSRALLDHYQEVYSIEGCRQRCEWISTSLRAFGDRLTVIHGGVHQLPFPDGSFDLVCCNGVLEWVAFGREGQVTELQLQALREFRRVLKPDGILYVGIENRLGLQYFRGGLDHPGTRFTSLMPRWLASMICSRSLGGEIFSMGKSFQSYRTYTYTRPTYLQLFKEAGLRHLETYCAEPCYNNPRYIFPWNVRAPEFSAFSRLILGRRRSLAFSRAFCNSLLFFAAPEPVDVPREASPVWIGFNGKLRIRDQTIVRETAAGSVTSPPFPGYAGHRCRSPRLTEAHVLGSYREFLGSPRSRRRNWPMNEVEGAFRQLFSAYFPPEAIGRFLEAIASHHLADRYHGDCVLENLMLDSRLQGHWIDEDDAPFGSPALDAADLVGDWVWCRRGDYFPAVDVSELCRSLEIRPDDRMLFTLAALRRSLRSSHLVRAHPAAILELRVAIDCWNGQRPLRPFPRGGWKQRLYRQLHWFRAKKL